PGKTTSRPWSPCVKSRPAWWTTTSSPRKKSSTTSRCSSSTRKSPTRPFEVNARSKSSREHPVPPARSNALPAIDTLADRLSTYLGPDQVNLVRRAYFYAEQAHDGQRRRSGEAYVTHPLAVANILADMHMDHQSLMAA